MAARKGKIGRRKLLAGAVALAGGTVAAVAAANQNKRALPAARPGSSLAGLAPGTRVGDCTVAEIYGVHLGAVPVVLEHDGDRFQVDVLKRDDRGPSPVGQTPSLALFLVNRGNGTRRTDEEHGAGAMALAEALAAREAAGATLPALLTLKERAARHPDGFFCVG